MNTSGRKQQEDIEGVEDLALSPVLNRKRISRRVANHKPYNRPKEPSQAKSPSSYIPVPVKDHQHQRGLDQCNKEPRTKTPPKLFSDVHTTSSSSLGNFKQQVISNCARSNILSPHKATSNQCSISEGTIINTLKCLPRNKTESDSKVVKHFKHIFNKARSRNSQYNKSEVKCGSGDISDEDMYTRRNTQPIKVAKATRTDLDMLYENAQFEGGSKTTVDSGSGSPSLSPSSSPSRSPRRQSYSQTPPQCIKEEDTDKEPGSQLNYNDTTDESDCRIGGSTAGGTAHAQERQNAPDCDAITRECKNKVKSAFLSTNVFEFSQVQAVKRQTSKNIVNVNLSPSLQQQIRSWTDVMEPEQPVEAQPPPTNHERSEQHHLFGNHGNGSKVFGNSDAPFLGFTTEEVDFIARKYTRYKNYLRALGIKKKKKMKTSSSNDQPQGRKALNKFNEVSCNKMAEPESSPMSYNTPNEITLNGVEIEPQDESVAVPANNRVQICIGNNRIQINIKSDKKPNSTIATNGSDSQGTTNAIDMPSAKSNETKCNSNGFWSFSTDDGKIREKRPENESGEFNTASGLTVVDNTKSKVATQGIYSKLEVESSVSNHFDARGKTAEFSSSGFKSASGQLITMSKGALQKAEEFLTDRGNNMKTINKSASFPADCGFKSAAGKPIALHSDSLRKTSHLFDNLDMNPGASSSGTDSSRGATTASTNLSSHGSTAIVKTSSNESDFQLAEPGAIHGRKILKAKSFRKSLFGEDFQEANKCDIIEFGKVQAFNFGFKAGFSSASGKKIIVSPRKLQKASAKFQDLDFAVPEPQQSANFGGFASASGKKLVVDAEKLLQVSAKFQDLDGDFPSHEKQGHSASYKEDQLQKAALGSDFESPLPKAHFGGFSSASGKKINVDPEKLRNAAGKFQDLEVMNAPSVPSTSSTKTAHELIEDVVQSYDKALERLNSAKKFNNFEQVVEQPKLEDTTPMKPSSSITMAKKRLGMSRVTRLSVIPKEKLEKARLLFDEGDKDLTITPMKSFCKTTKNPPIACFNNATTPITNRFTKPTIQSNGHVNDRVITSTPFAQRGLNNFSNVPLDITPIKSTEPESEATQRKRIHDGDEDCHYDGILLFREKSCSNLQKLQNDIELEYMHLKKKLEILEERKKALEFQRYVIDQPDPEHSRPRLGILSIRKKNSTKRIKLSELTSVISENTLTHNIDIKIQEITARNADRLHFSSTKNDKSVVHTLDGGKVIPNTKNTIGVTEVNNAFQAMNGIEPKLIPKGWVANHYKWIVWKLASYERKFPEGFKDCLTVDGIMQQLKYRYDREIDRASRPAIRRIMEKDDVPNKRMVLCVADIIQICSNKYEILLTDGWYSIRTVIDNLLNKQIISGKLTNGAKLMIQGAELLNCDDGCHPLEASEHVKLKICFNNTRRALWHVRLGYYHIAAPFPIRLRHIQPDGGQVARVKVYIVRVYPLRYMEEINGVKTWRNAKAEEKRAMEFESERMQEFESIKNQVYDEYEATLKTLPGKVKSMKQVESVTCPRQLNHLMEASHDPEGLYSMLSTSQKNILMEFKINSASERQRDISERVAKRMEELKFPQRYLTPMLKLLVTDALEDNAKCTVLNVWKPSEEQVQSFEEESCISIYNVQVKRSHELNTGRRTMFQLHEDVTNKRCQRQLLPISMTTDAYYKPLFNEFDTVGVVVEIVIKEHDQEVWLADFTGRLLYVKIIDGPKVCSLLDGVKLGETLAFCNLLMHLPHCEFGQCVANQYSTIMKHPRQKYLQQGLEQFNSQISDMPKLVNTCQAKIEQLRAHVNLKSNKSYQDYALMHKSHVNVTMFDDSFDENASIPSRLTMMDVAMSLIDTDKLN